MSTTTRTIISIIVLLLGFLCMIISYLEFNKEHPSTGDYRQPGYYNEIYPSTNTGTYHKVNGIHAHNNQ